MNKCFFIGRTTKDIELRAGTRRDGSEYSLASFSLAIDDGYGDNKTTVFINCQAWNKAAETLEKYVKKGTKIAVEARAKQNKYKNRDGVEVSTYVFVVDSFEFCESKKAAGGADQAQAAVDEDGFMQVTDNLEDGGLPFV